MQKRSIRAKEELEKIETQIKIEEDKKPEIDKKEK